MRKFFILSILLTYLFAIGGIVYAQSASLIATVHVNPLEVEIILPGNVEIGEWFKITAIIINHGSEKIKHNRVSIYPPPEVSVRGSNEKGVGILRPGGTRTISWWIRVDSPSANFVLIEVVGTLLGEEVSASDTVSIPIITTTTLSLLWSRFLRINLK